MSEICSIGVVSLTWVHIPDAHWSLASLNLPDSHLASMVPRILSLFSFGRDRAQTETTSGVAI